jgi:hypothetical protein
MFQPDLSNLSHQDNNRQLTEISPSLRRTVDVLESWSTDVMRSGSHQPRRLLSISNQSSPVNPSNLALSFPFHLVNIQVSPRGRIGPSHGNTFHEPISRIFAFPTERTNSVPTKNISIKSSPPAVPHTTPSSSGSRKQSGSVSAPDVTWNSLISKNPRILYFSPFWTEFQGSGN